MKISESCNELYKIGTLLEQQKNEDSTDILPINLLPEFSDGYELYNTGYRQPRDA